MAQEDCALLRVFDGGVCRPYEDYEDDVSLAALEPLAPHGANSRAHHAEQGAGVLSELGYIEAGLSVQRGPGRVQIAAGAATRRSGARLINTNDNAASGLSPLY
jgi:hypothetical protein